jgi:hypothetical protein
MQDAMPIPFEPTRSYVYRAARYEILPRIAEIVRPFGTKPFLLRSITRQVLADTYTQEQLDIRIKNARSEKTDKVSTIFGFFIPYLAEDLKVFENVGGGLFKNIPLDEELAEAEAVATDVDSDESGTIYAYSFSLIQKVGERFPIKVGLTTTGNAQVRVVQQCRQTCCFEPATILGEWDVPRVAAVESAIHSTLEARGFRRDSPGSEWFDTTIREIEEIIQFVESQHCL